MKKGLSGFILALTITSQVQAGYLANVAVNDVIAFSSGAIHFNMDNPPQSSTCDYWGYDFRFDATSQQGQNMFKLLSAAAITGARINVSFTESSTPGTNHNGGCTKDTMAKPWGINYKSK